MRPYCRLLLYCGALISITFLLYVTLTRDSSLSTFEEEKGVKVETKTGSPPPPSSNIIKNDFLLKQQQQTQTRPVVKLEIYMESLCPDTTRFINAQLTPTFNQLRDYISLKIIPFGKASWSEKTLDEEDGGGGKDYSFQCQHGPRECAVNQLMCCGIERLRSADKYLPYVACLQGTLPGAAEQTRCADAARLDHQQIQECADGRQGRLLHYKMGLLTKALQPSAFFIPWAMVDGVREKTAFDDLKKVVCEKLQTKYQINPKACTIISSTVSAVSSSATRAGV